MKDNQMNIEDHPLTSLADIIQKNHPDWIVSLTIDAPTEDFPESYGIYASVNVIEGRTHPRMGCKQMVSHELAKTNLELISASVDKGFATWFETGRKQYYENADAIGLSRE